MTTIQRLKATPMAPYIGLMQKMTREEKRIVVTFLTESMEDPAEDVVEIVPRVKLPG